MSARSVDKNVLEGAFLATEGVLLTVGALVLLYNRIFFSDALLAEGVRMLGDSISLEKAHLVGMMHRVGVWPLHYVSSILLALTMLWHGTLFCRIEGGLAYPVLSFLSFVSLAGGAAIFMQHIPALSYLHYLTALLLVSIYVYLLGRWMGVSIEISAATEAKRRI